MVAGRIPLYVELTSCYHAGSFQEHNFGHGHRHLSELLLAGARRALAAGADAVGVYPRHHAVDQLDLWGTLAA